MLTVLRLADQATGPPGAPAASVGPATVTSVSFRGHRGFPGQVDSCPCLPSQWQLRQGGRHGGDPGAGRQAPLRGEGPPVACRPGATALGVLGRPERGQHSPAAPGLQQCLEAWAAGKGTVTSLPPGICCLEASPWRPEGSGRVKIANPRGCKFPEHQPLKRKENMVLFLGGRGGTEAGPGVRRRGPTRWHAAGALRPGSLVPRPGVASVTGSAEASGRRLHAGFSGGGLGAGQGGCQRRGRRFLPQRSGEATGPARPQPAPSPPSPALVQEPRRPAPQKSLGCLPPASPTPARGREVTPLAPLQGQAALAPPPLTLSMPSTHCLDVPLAAASGVCWELTGCPQCQATERRLRGEVPGSPSGRGCVQISSVRGPLSWCPALSTVLSFRAISGWVALHWVPPS